MYLGPLFNFSLWASIHYLSNINLDYNFLKYSSVFINSKKRPLPTQRSNQENFGFLESHSCDEQLKKQKQKLQPVHSSLIDFFFFFWPYHAGRQDPSFLTKDQTHAPRIGNTECYHWTTRKFPLYRSLKILGWLRDLL